jgi:LPS-assembly protein
MNYSIMPQRVMDSNLLFYLDTNYIDFVRDSSAFDHFDGTTKTYSLGTGKYDSNTDVIRTGQRLDIEPTLSYPITFGEAIDFVPSVSYRETRYQFPLGDQPATYRRYVRTNLDLSTHFSHIFAPDEENPLANRYKHVIQPEISYSTIPWSNQPNHPFFQGTEFEPNYLKDQPISDNDIPQFDYHDRIYDKNLVTYAITNKIIRKRWVQGTPKYDQVIRDKVWQSFDIYENNRATHPRYPWSEISNLLEVNLDLFELNYLFKFYPYQNLTSDAARVRVYNSRKDYIEAVYSQDFLINSGVNLDNRSKTRDLTLGGGFNIKYFQFAGSTTYDLQNSAVQSYQYKVALKPPGNCWALIFSQQLLTESHPEMHFNISFLFDGKTDANFTNRNI